MADCQVRSSSFFLPPARLFPKQYFGSTTQSDLYHHMKKADYSNYIGFTRSFFRVPEQDLENPLRKKRKSEFFFANYHKNL